MLFRQDGVGNWGRDWGGEEGVQRRTSQEIGWETMTLQEKEP